ncbi:MAG: HYR domain-containing protein [Flavobacteriales bacterium]|nr:HYR domain-containing protein [Flavobacteriales bacterium]
MKTLQSLTTTLTLLFIAALAEAQTSYTWNGSASTAWTTNTNWTPNGIPGNLDNVTIVTGSNNCVIAANTQVTNLTMTSGTLNLGGFTLTTTGVTTMTNGSVNNGNLNITGTTVTFTGTTFGAAVTSTTSTLLFNGGTFNNTVTSTKTGASNDAGNGGCTFNGVSSFTNTGSGYLMFGNNAGTPDIWNADVTFTNSGSERILPCWNAVGNQFNGNITVNTSGSSQGIHFCGGGGSPTATLAATKTISAGGTGLNGGYLILRRFTQLGSAAVNLTLGSSATYVQFGPNSAMGGNVTVTSPGIYLHGCTFSGTSSFTMTGFNNTFGTGGNTFTGAASFTNTGSAQFGLGNGLPDTWLSTANFDNSGTGYIYVAHNNNGVNSFAGAVTINNTSATTGNAGIRFAEASLGGTVTFNSTVSITNGGTGTANYIGIAHGGNSNTVNFNGDLTINQNNTGTSASVVIGYASTINLNGNVTVSNTSGNSSVVMFGQNSGSVTLATGKTISIGGSGFSNGTLYLRRFTQVGSTAQTLTLTGNAGLYYGPSSTFNGNITSSSPTLFLNGAVFNGTTSITKTGGTGDNSAGGNTFNGVTTITNTGSNYLALGQSTPDTFNNDVTFTNTGTDRILPAWNTAGNVFNGNITLNTTGTGTGIHFCGSGPATATLAATKTISIGGSGFNAGYLILQNFTQLGSAAVSLTLASTANYIQFGPNSTIGGNATINSPRILLHGCNFQGTSDFTKTGTTNDAGNGGNTFTGATVFNNSGSGYFMTGNGAADQFLSTATFNNSGASVIYLAHSHSLLTTTFSGAVTINNTSTSSSGNPGVRFAESGVSAIVTFNGAVSVNNGGTGNGNMVSFAPSNNGNIVNFNSTVNVVQNNTGTSAVTLFGGTATINLSENIVVSNTSGNSSYIGFTTNGGTTTLASGKTITIGGGGFTNGTLYLRRFISAGVTAQNITLTSIAGLVMGPSSVFNGTFTSSSPSVYLNGTTFNSTSNITKTGSAGDYSNGGNVFNGVSTLTNTGTNFFLLGNTTPDTWNNDVYFINSGTERILPCYATAGNQFNGDIYVSSTGTAQGINFCGGNASASATLAATKTVMTTGAGYTSGYLILQRFTQLGSAPINLTFTSTASYIQFGPASTMGGNVTTNTPRIYLEGCLFQGTTDFTKTGSANDHSSGGNTFTGASVFNHAGTGNFLTGNTAGDTWLSTATFNNSGNGIIYPAYGHSGNTSTFTGAVTINNTSTSTSGNPGVRFAEASSNITVNFMSTVNVNNAGTCNGNYISFAGSTGNNTMNFNGVLTVNQTNTGSGAITYIGNQGTINLNENVVVNNTSGPNSWVGFSMNSGSTTLANGKTITVGGTGFTNGTLYLRRFNQVGGTPQSLTLTGTSSLVYGPSSVFNGNVTSTSPGLYFMGCTFNGTTNCTKNGSSGDTSSGNNLFVGTSVISNTGSGNLVMGSGASDIWQGNATFNNSGTAVLYIAHNHNNLTTVFNGTVTVNVTSGGTGTHGVRFAEASSTGVINFNAPVTVNNGGTGSSCFVGFANSTAGNTINFNSTLTINQTNTGTSAIVQVGNSSNIYLNDNVVVNNTSGNNSWIGFSTAGGATTLASGKTITVGSTGFNGGTLYLRRITQVGTTAQSLALTGSALLAIQNSSVFNANIYATSPQVVVEGSTFNGTSRFIKTGGNNNYSAGGNTFNGPTHFINNSIAEFGLANGTSDDFNNLARFVQRSSGAMRPIHNATSNFSGDIAVDSCTTAITFCTNTNGYLNIDGTSQQIFSGDAAFAPTVNRLIMNNGSGGSLLLNVNVHNGISTTFSNGSIYTGSGNYYGFNSAATYTGASNNSHVAGTARRLGTGSFIYPVGNGTVYQPVAVNATANSAGLLVSYSATDAGTAPFSGGSASPPNLSGYNNQEYWNINPSGSATGTVTVNWDGVNDTALGSLAEAKVGHKISGNWQNEGGTGSGTVSAGSVTSNSLTTWGIFALGQNCATPLTLTCPSNVTVTAAAGSCNAAVTIAPATATDVCGTTIITNSYNAGGADASGSYPIGVNPVTFTATASNGLTSTCTIYVTVLDAGAPTITCPANISQNITTGCNTSLTVPAPTVSDECTPGHSLHFNGTPDMVTVPDAAALQLTSDFTIEAFVYLDNSPTDWVRFVGKGGTSQRNYGLWYHKPNNSWLFQALGTDNNYISAQYNSTINLNTWYHIAGVKSGNSYTLYVNGTQVATANANFPPYTSSAPLTLGYAGFHTYHMGNLDNVRIWNSALTPAQILCSSQGTPCANPTGLITNYDMESGVGWKHYVQQSLHLTMVRFLLQ